jgi:hypothetical protein
MASHTGIRLKLFGIAWAVRVLGCCAAGCLVATGIGCCQTPTAGERSPTLEERLAGISVLGVGGEGLVRIWLDSGRTETVHKFVGKYNDPSLYLSRAAFNRKKNVYYVTDETLGGIVEIDAAQEKEPKVICPLPRGQRPQWQSFTVLEELRTLYFQKGFAPDGRWSALNLDTGDCVPFRFKGAPLPSRGSIQFERAPGGDALWLTVESTVWRYAPTTETARKVATLDEPMAVSLSPSGTYLLIPIPFVPHRPFWLAGYAVKRVDGKPLAERFNIKRLNRIKSIGGMPAFVAEDVLLYSLHPGWHGPDAGTYIYDLRSGESRRISTVYIRFWHVISEP